MLKSPEESITMPKPTIADYDNSQYDYRTYWKDREYENEIEHKTLDSLLPLVGDSLLDIGGSFGRLMDVYAKRFRRVVIYDYSGNALEQAQQSAQKKGFKSIETVKGDAYTLPFDNDSFDVVLMIRVLHHIEQPEKLFSEITRILKPNGIFIIDIPNKIHLKNRILHLLDGNASYFKDKNPQHIGSSTIDNQTGIFINYHPEHIISLLTTAGFTIEEKISILNARIPLLKKIFSTNIIVGLDVLLQPLFTPDYLGPQIWVKCKLTEKNP